MNPFGRSAREQREYERHRHPGADTLLNKLDIKEPKVLEAAERYLAAKRLEEGLPIAAFSIDYSGLMTIHRHLFQDIYECAGTERTYTTGRGKAPFAPSEQIRPWLEKQFAALEQE